MKPIGIVPAADSPDNILNSLNNDCIKEIFRRMNIAGFLSAARTCKRFQENAIACYPFKDFNIVKDGSENHLSTRDVKEFIAIFGPLIKSINWKKSYGKRKKLWKSVLDAKFKTDIFHQIAKCCGETLVELYINGQFVHFQKGTEFKVLEKLTLCNVTVRKSASFPKLKDMKLLGVNDYNAVKRSDQLTRRFVRAKNFNWLRQNFPNLENAVFALTTLMTDDVIIEFQQFNSQLKNLTLYNHYPYRITSSVLEEIPRRLPNLTSFKTYGIKSRPDAETDLKFLMQLENLKCFQIPYKYNRSIFREIIASFPDNNIHLEHLGISYAYYAAKDNELVETVSKLTFLKEVTLEGVSCAKDIINIVKNIPNLERLNLSACRNSYSNDELPLDEIKKTISVCKKLKKIVFEFMYLDIDTDVYEAILELIEGRVSFTLLTYSGIIDVDKKMLEKNRKWLDVGKSRLPKVFFQLN